MTKIKPKLLRLDWDSDFFDFNVGKIEGLIQNEKDVKKVELLLAKNNIKLSYYSNPNELPSFASISDKYDIVLVDKKTNLGRSR